ncbi:hypothetical protein DH2020_045828 [Rehmannia glutinosa]|uniref:Uncharacterized protein n=1 Tax=Rehmannia glutinosa TaxID=99300 RepID=A0ABR0UDL9_REHGL
MPACQPEETPVNSGSTKEKNASKRKSAECEDPLVETMGTFCRNTDARLGDIAKRIGFEYDISMARKEVFGMVCKIEGLSLQEKLLVSKLLVKNTEDLELFFSLPTEAKAEFVRMKLVGNLDEFEALELVPLGESGGRAFIFGLSMFLDLLNITSRRQS